MARFTLPADLFPPPITAIRLRERDDALGIAIAEAVERGAGTLYLAGHFALAEFALVLEPDAPLQHARRAMFAGMNALADALAAHAPPEKPLEFAYPGLIIFDGAPVAAAHLASPPGTAEDAVPEWLVFAATIKLNAMVRGAGFVVEASLAEEGFNPVAIETLVSNVTRHLLVELDEWQERGFSRVGRRYLDRLSGRDGAARRGIDEFGNLLAQPAGTPIITARLDQALATDHRARLLAGDDGAEGSADPAAAGRVR